MGSATSRHGHGHGRWRHAATPHSHDARDAVDRALAASRKGMRALWISFAALLVTALGQAVLVAFTGSVALLSDTLHNFADALTAVPLAVAFLLARRAATRRFTYGLGRAEDLAGLAVLAVIAASAAAAGWEAVRRLVESHPVAHSGWLAVAGLLGFVGNELVARYRIRVGREIGSAALVADGRHARTDGFTSLGVLGSAAGTALGWWWVDPVVGVLITAAIAVVLWGSAKDVLARMLDAVDPELVLRAERVLAATPGVRAVGGMRMRWVGHALRAEAELDVDPDLSLAAAHHIAHTAEHNLCQALPRLGGAVLHAHPSGAHDVPSHHGDRPRPRPAG
ncbi:cation efflux system protein [Saccharopolyspora subtropica]|uniref:Cation efflux system protein n=1 Tax=Saccharopolyspora thermophila TaxID=89367 RepID=A0A917JVE1_9PSEU|nr:cation diffusion facilitator family transporter [Saccharopolyspora subtropica]GGI88646.1 cation efflux system protein [Saccharopolyspora subtropica]